MPLYQSLGFDVLKIGEEAIVDLRGFTTAGKAGRNFRTAINKFTKAGFHFELQKPPISDQLLRELRSVSDEGLQMMHGSEKKFSVGWFDEDYLCDCEIALVRTPEGQISAFANLTSFSPAGSHAIWYFSALLPCRILPLPS